GRKRRLGDAKQQRTAGCGTPTFGDDAVVFLAEAELVHLLLEKERGVADVFDLHPAHHLAGDGLDVLVVDVDALQAVDLLNGVDEIGLSVLLAQNREQVVEVEWAVDERFTCADVLALLNVDVSTTGDSVFFGGLAVFAFHVNLAHTLGDVAVADGAVDFADDGGGLWFAGFEELDDAPETTGDVL